MKKLLVAFAVVCGAISVNASYLYWQVDTGLDDVQSWAQTAGNWTTANITISDGADHQVTGTLKNLDINESGFKGRTGVTEINLESLTGATAGWSYYIELVNSSVTPSSTIGFQEGTYADLSGSIITAQLDVENIQQAAVWHGSEGGYRAAPEPTSAMLMMLGAAMLGLRRKQRKQA